MYTYQNTTNMTPINGLFLIDDDNIFNLIHLKTMAKVNFAQNVKAFEDASKALDVLRHIVSSRPDFTPELIFLDINMPGMNGWEFLDMLNNFPEHVFENCKVIMLSSSIDPSDIEKSKKYKMVYDFISKPLTPLKLQALSSKLFCGVENN
jgi:CheY-like chemotaxis protein